MTAPLHKVAAYAVCIRDEWLLLARFVSPDDGAKHWTLPGGSVEHGEDPIDAMVREVAEETGYVVSVTRLLGVDSRVHVIASGQAMHSVGVFYAATIVGGTLQSEQDGSTDLAEWRALKGVAKLERATLVDIGLALHKTMPVTGHVPPIAPGGLLRP